MRARAGMPTAAALLAAGVLGLHQLRYLAGHGDHAANALERGGHGYLPLAGIVTALLLGLACALLVRRIASAASPTAHVGDGSSFRRAWLAATLALLLAHVLQEQVEGVLAPGHGGALAALSAQGGWLVLPLAIGFGALVALALRGEEALLRALGPRHRRYARRRPHARQPRPASALLPLPGVLASNLAGRAPPLDP